MADSGQLPGPDVKGTPYDALINAAAHENGIRPALLAGLIQQESHFDPLQTSRAGAQGLTQLMPETAASLGVTDAHDPEQSIDGGAKYLGEQLKRFGGNETLALAAYNAGPGNVEKYGGVPPFAETQAYVNIVEANAEAFERGHAPQIGESRATPRSLENGSRGSDVAVAQRELGVRPDGDFGPKTEHAVREFQSEHGLRVDGIIGPETRAALENSREVPQAVPAPVVPDTDHGPASRPSASDGWAASGAPGAQKLFAPSLQAFEKLYAGQPAGTKVDARFDQNTSTVSVAFDGARGERYVATVRVGEGSWNKNFSAHDIVPGKYKLVEPAQIPSTDPKAASLGVAWTHIVNADGVDRIMAKDGSSHSAVGMHGGSSELAAEFGLDAARASHQDLRKTEGCIRMHNEDALSLSNIVTKAGGSLDFDIRGSVSRSVGVQEAVERLRTDTGFGLPPAGHVAPWDGKPHEGTFVRVDEHTWAQHLGRGSYQTYDVDHDFRGSPPTVEGQRLEIDARGHVAPPHETAQHIGR